MLKSFGGIIVLPELPMNVSGTLSTGNVTIDADGEGIGCIFQVPETGLITGISIATSTVTTPDAGMDFRLESVNLAATPAIPSGSLIAAGRNALVDVNASAGWFTGTFTTPYAATQGELLAAIVVRRAGGTFNGIIRVFGEEGNNTSLSFPLSVSKLGASWAAGTLAPAMAINYGSSYKQIRGLWPMLDNFSQPFDNASDPDVLGNIWIPRMKCRVMGLWAWLDMDGPVLLKFYDTDGVTVLATCSAPANQRATVNTAVIFLPFDATLGPTSVTPTVGQTYRIGIEPTSGAGVTVVGYVLGAAAVMDTFSLGTNMYMTTAKDPSGLGSWTDIPTQRVPMGVIIDQMDDGVGGGIISKSLIAGGG